MTRQLRALIAGALLVAALSAVVVLSGVLPLEFAASDSDRNGETEVRVQARETAAGRVEVRAQSRLGGNEWATHEPEARFLPVSPEPGRWYSSNPFAVSVAATVPDVSDPAPYTQWFVREAIARYERDGLAQTVEYYNSPESIDGQWYVFIIGESGVTIANRNQDLVGMHSDDINGPDGYPAGRVVVAAARINGAWVDYQFDNPATGQAEIKHSWVVRHDGLIFGSGWYEDAPSKVFTPGAFAQSYVERALEMYRVLGREAVIAYHNSPESVDGEWYVSIYELDGTRLAHPYLPLGENLLDGGPDVTGRNFREEFIAIADRGWVSYVFLNPDTGEQEQKHTWVVRHGGLLFTSGWYEAGAYTAPDS